MPAVRPAGRGAWAAWRQGKQKNEDTLVDLETLLKLFFDFWDDMLEWDDMSEG